MYNESGTIAKVAGGLGSASAGIAVLPATGGNSIGQLLAYGAIIIGFTALVGQLVVYLVRRHYASRAK